MDVQGIVLAATLGQVVGIAVNYALHKMLLEKLLRQHMEKLARHNAVG